MLYRISPGLIYNWKLIPFERFYSFCSPLSQPLICSLWHCAGLGGLAGVPRIITVGSSGVVPTPAWVSWAAFAVPTGPRCPGPALLQHVPVDLALRSQQLPPHHCADAEQRPEILPLPLVPSLRHLDSDGDAAGDYQRPHLFGASADPSEPPEAGHLRTCRERSVGGSLISSIALENWGKILERDRKYWSEEQTEFLCAVSNELHRRPDGTTSEPSEKAVILQEQGSRL